MKVHFLLSLWTLLRQTNGFSGGAPESVCDGSMMPRHGFDPQDVSSSAEIVVDQYTMRSDHYLRVTLRAQVPFKGFLLKAEDILDQSKQSFGLFSAFGTWYIPYLNDSDAEVESSYLHCNGGLQNAVTHTGKHKDMYVVSFQWKPPADYQGMVTFRATVVRDYKTFWTDITSPPVHIVSSNQHIIVDSDHLLGHSVEQGQTVQHDLDNSDDQYDQYEEKMTTFSWSTTSFHPTTSIKVKSPRINSEGERDYYNSRRNPWPSNYKHKDKDKMKVSSQSTNSPKPSYQSIKSTITASQTTRKSVKSSENKNKQSDSKSRESPPLQNNSELNRMPRTNEDATQIPYERLQADFGGFDDYSDVKNGADPGSMHSSRTAIIMSVVYQIYKIVMKSLCL